MNHRYIKIRLDSYLGILCCSHLAFPWYGDRHSNTTEGVSKFQLLFPNLQLVGARRGEHLVAKMLLSSSFGISMVLRQKGFQMNYYPGAFLKQKSIIRVEYRWNEWWSGIVSWLQTVKMNSPVMAYIEMAVSFNNKYLALYTSNGFLWIGSSDLQVRQNMACYIWWSRMSRECGVFLKGVGSWPCNLKRSQMPLNRGTCHHVSLHLMTFAWG